MKPNQIIQGDTLEVLKKLPSDLVDTIITSSPYWGLRDYGTATWEGGDENCNHRIDRFGNRKVTDKTNIDQSKQKSLAGEFVPVGGNCPKCRAKRIDLQIGLESTLEEFIEKLLKITKELKRVLKPTGVMYWNHGDSYATKSGSGKIYENIMPGYEEKIKSAGLRSRKLIEEQGIPRKSLFLQNYRLVLKMIDQQGWILRNTIIWHKPNHMPSSVKDRFTNSYEPVFMLVKNKKYWFDLDAVRVKTQNPEADFKRVIFDIKGGTKKHQQGGVSAFKTKNIEEVKARIYAGKNPGDVWKIPTQPFPEAHFATFPEKLITPMILSSCPKEICKKCGKARVRIFESLRDRKQELQTADEIDKHTKGKYEHTKFTTSTGYMHRDKSPDGKTSGMYNLKKAIGWTDCKCNVGWKAGIVLDPFIGSGTVAVVAKRYMRNYLGIELNPKYIKIAQARIKAQPVPML